MFEDRIIFDTIVGSQAYGINLPSSDTDTVAVCIPTLEYFFSFKKFEQTVGKTEQGDDRTIYDFRKTVDLILGNNPNMLDLLFAPDRCIRKTTSYWEAIREMRDSFISKRCKFTYSGYAFNQLERIRSHRAYLLNPPKKEPERKDFNLPEKSIFPASQLDGIILLADDFFEPETREELVEDLRDIYSDQVLPLIKKHLVPEYHEIALESFAKGYNSQINAIKAIGNEYLKDDYKEMAINELSYASAMKGWKRYQQWKLARNKKRAELEENFGFDTKHSAHLIRLLKMGKEILLTGKINVDRTNIDADELKAIRAGALTYEQVIESAENIQKELDSLYHTCTLPKTPSVGKVSEKLVEVIDRYFKDNK